MLSEIEKNRIIEMAWEDRTPFEAIEFQFGLNESQVIDLMRAEMKRSSFEMWRKRMNQKNTKHLKKRTFKVGKHKCTLQRNITHNKISKR